MGANLIVVGKLYSQNCRRVGEFSSSSLSFQEFFTPTLILLDLSSANRVKYWLTHRPNKIEHQTRLFFISTNLNISSILLVSTAFINKLLVSSFNPFVISHVGWRGEQKTPYEDVEIFP